jgi:PTH2 family peptidyl-tRNA hydrolase
LSTGKQRHLISRILAKVFFATVLHPAHLSSDRLHPAHQALRKKRMSASSSTDGGTGEAKDGAIDTEMLAQALALSMSTATTTPAPAPAPPAEGSPHLGSLLEMGFDKFTAENALQQTGGKSLEAAATFILTGELPPKEPAWPQQHLAQDMKMVMVVRTDLGLGAGKIAAQCVHAALGAVRQMRTLGKQAQVDQWTATGEAAVTLQVPSLAKMMQLDQHARQTGLNSHIVADAGRTQVAAGSQTVLAIGPASVAEVDVVTRSLKLL